MPDLVRFLSCAANLWSGHAGTPCSGNQRGLAAVRDEGAGRVCAFRANVRILVQDSVVRREPSVDLNNVHLRWRHILRIVPGVTLSVVFLLAGCGQVTQSRMVDQTSTQTSTPVANRSPAIGNDATANGCPSKQIPVDGGVFHADVTVTYTLDQGSAQPVTLSHGQHLEIHLDPLVQWGLTITDADHILQSSIPTGWYDASSKTCVWRFIVGSAGVAHLAFKGLVLCQPSIRCKAALEQAAFDVTAR
jgi:hypothetical protein